ncbi:MAG: hypothetical protein QOI41_5768 [Myxococcales bacterium]|nr:hypothetical protein [Myxococcales bacterium]
MTMTTTWTQAALVALGLGCGCAQPQVAPLPAPTARTSAAMQSASPPPPASATPVARKLPPDAAAIYARVESGLVRCYETGKKATPEMMDGRLTLNASIDASGKTTCVIPSDHTGLTQDVEDCMSARFAAETFDAGSAAWSAAVPIVLRAGVLHRGDGAGNAAVIDSVETIRMPDAFDVLEALEPALQGCIRSADRSGGVHGLLVGARVGADGRPQCALASSGGPLPAGVGECASAVLRGAKFPPPKRGSGIVLVPINVVGSK